jgi:tRNA A37 threonylcarbamoyladenosine dehydratase
LESKSHPCPERFAGVWHLYGRQAFDRFARSHICVIGIGGVGSWAVEALARSGIGRITLVDPDRVALTNLNRQIQALDSTLGSTKTEALKQRIRQINPDCQVKEITTRLSPENVAETIGGRNFDYVVEAIDDIYAKAATIAYCHEYRIPLVSSGGAAGQTDPTQIVVSDMSKTQQDSLLARTRRLLRKQYGFPRGTGSFGVDAVYSMEPLKYPEGLALQLSDDQIDETNTNAITLRFGSSVVVTASFGLTAAAVVLRRIAESASSH